MVDDVIEQRQNNFNQEKFEQLEATSEYMETFYYNTKLTGGQETTNLIQDNQFWCDFADHLISGKKEGFVSHNFTLCTSPI